MLCAPLLGLANIMLSLILSFLLAIANKGSRSVAELTGKPILGALAEVLNLAASFLLLAFAVLLTAGLLELLGADGATDELLGCSGGLLPRAGGAVGVVGGDGAVGGGGEAGQLGGVVRGGVLGVGLLLLEFTFGLCCLMC